MGNVKHKTRQIITTRRHGLLAELRQGPNTETFLAPHFHSELQVILSERRLISYTLKGETILSPLSSVFLIEPEVVHSAKVEKYQRTWGDLRTLLIPPDCFARYLGEALDHFRPAYSTPAISSSRLMNNLSRAHLAIQRSSNNLQCESILTEALRSLVLHSGALAIASNRTCDRRLQMVRDRLANELDRNMTLSEVAGAVELSPFHVVRIFRKKFGLSPHAFRTQLRLAKVKELLQTGMGISEIALLTGFSDHAHLTRTFHRFVGVPPSKYMNRNIIQDREDGVEVTLHGGRSDSES